MNALTLVVLIVGLPVVIALCYHAWVVLPREMRAIYKQGLAAFARAIDARSNGLYGTTQQVVLLSLGVGQQMRFSGREMRRLEFAAYLRDIGLAAVPYRIINNLEQLTEAERFTFIRHAEAGAAMLENIVYLRELAPIVRYHHDFWNGDGILPRAKSARLPKEAAVIAAVTQYSFWKTAYGHDMALEMVRKGSGTQFNPETTRALSIILETHHEPNYWDMLRQSVAVFLT